MTTHNRDYDDVLRRALHAAAESVEPSPDGLERIRARMGTSSGPSFASAVAWYHEVALAIATRAGPLFRAAADTFWSAIDRFRPASATPGENGRRNGWIRPAAAAGTAIFVVAAGAFAIMTLPHAISSSDGSAFTTWPWEHSAGSGGSGGNGGLNGNSHSQIAGGVSASGTTGYSAAPDPAASKCRSLGSSPTGTQSSTPPIVTAPATTPPTSSSPPVSSPPASTPPTSTGPTTTPPVSTTPAPGSENTPIPSPSSPATDTTGQSANGTDAVINPKDAAVVPSPSSSPSSSGSPSANPCVTTPAATKTSGQPSTSSDVSAYSATALRLTEAAAKHG